MIRSILFLLVLMSTSCNKSPSQADSSSSSDPSSNQELRLAALSPGIAVMLRDLGYEDQIVAKHEYDMVLSDQVSAAGSEIGFDLEVLIQTNPTHLFFQKTTADRSPRLLALAKERGWVIFERPLNTLDDIASTMDDLYFLFEGLPERRPRQYDMNEVLGKQTPSVALANSLDDLGPAADRAGRVLVLGSVDPIGVMGPGSYHHQIIERLGATPAIVEGAMWIEMDYEDLIALNPDSIIYIAPRQSTVDDRFGTGSGMTIEEIKAIFGPIAELPIAAVEHGRIGVIDHPLGLLPSGALAQVAEQIRALMESWEE